MSKQLVGHHLLRVRIKKKIFSDMQQIAEEESIRSREHVTVSDLVRSACYNYILLHTSLRNLEALAYNMTDASYDDEEDNELSFADAVDEEIQNMNDYIEDSQYEEREDEAEDEDEDEDEDAHEAVTPHSAIRSSTGSNILAIQRQSGKQTQDRRLPLGRDRLVRFS